jgi:hypothetical protein
VQQTAFLVDVLHICRSQHLQCTGATTHNTGSVRGPVSEDGRGRCAAGYTPSCTSCYSSLAHTVKEYQLFLNFECSYTFHTAYMYCTYCEVRSKLHSKLAKLLLLIDTHRQQGVPAWSNSGAACCAPSILPTCTADTVRCAQATLLIGEAGTPG